MRLYQVVQNIDKLRGHYLISAVVVAATRAEARRVVMGYARRAKLECERERVVVRRLGRLAKTATLDPVGVNMVGGKPILAITTGEDV